MQGAHRKGERGKRSCRRCREDIAHIQAGCTSSLRELVKANMAQVEKEVCGLVKAYEWDTLKWTAKGSRERRMERAFKSYSHRKGAIDRGIHYR